jgi:hypothetical protein
MVAPFALSVVTVIISGNAVIPHQGQQVPGSAGRAGGFAFFGGRLRQFVQP